MLDNSVLNVVISLIFIFLLYSLLATAMQEAIANMLQRRANMLFYGIKCMLTNTINNNDVSKFGLIAYHLQKSAKTRYKLIKSFFVKKTVNTLHEQFYDHPIIKNFGQNSLFSRPSYLGSENFSAILIDTLKNLDKENESKAATSEIIKKILSDFKVKGDYAYYHPPAAVPVVDASSDGAIADAVPDTVTDIAPDGSGEATERNLADPDRERIRIPAETLQIINFHLNEAGGDLDVFKHRLEQWFDDTMNRVTGWYKKNTHYWLFCIGMFLAVTLNIDTIAISNFLSKNKAAAEQLAKMGEAAANNGTYSKQDSVITQTALDSIKKDMQVVNTLVGLGWGDFGRSDTNFIRSLKGRTWYTFSGRWYTLGLPVIPGCISVADTFKSIANKTLAIVSDSERLYRQRSDTILLKESSLAARFKSTKSKQDSLALDTVKTAAKEAAGKLYTYQAKKDSFVYRAFYENQYEHYPVYVKTAYIYSKIDWQKFFGFFITALAIGLGAPFWFDLLNKFVSIRSSGKTANISAGATTSSSKNKDTISG